MVITREDIAKKLDFDDPKTMRATKGLGDLMQNYFAGKTSKGDASGSSHTGMKLRERRKVAPSPERYRLTQMNTALFEQLMGEDAAPDTIEQKKALKEQKKTEHQVRLNAICALNSAVVKEGNINNEELSDDNEMDKTVPLNSSQLSEVQIDSNGPPEVPLRNTECNSSNARGNDLKEKAPEVPQHKTEGKGLCAGDNNLKDPPTSETNSHSQGIALNSEKVDMSSQTELVMISCGCQRCKALFKTVDNIITAASLSNCEMFPISKDSSTVMQAESSMDLIGRDGQQKVPLYNGSVIKISVTDKALLKNLDGETPKDYVNFIMDAMYDDPSEIANMTANGQRKGTKGMDKTVKLNLLAYIQHKFKDHPEYKGSKIKKKDLNTLINNHCYSERRKLWHKLRTDESDAVASKVRAPLQKYQRDPTKPQKPSKKSGKSSSKKSKSKGKEKRSSGPDGASGDVIVSDARASPHRRHEKNKEKHSSDPDGASGDLIVSDVRASPHRRHESHSKSSHRGHHKKPFQSSASQSFRSSPRKFMKSPSKSKHTPTLVKTHRREKSPKKSEHFTSEIPKPKFTRKNESKVKLNREDPQYSEECQEGKDGKDRSQHVEQCHKRKVTTREERSQHGGKRPRSTKDLLSGIHLEDFEQNIFKPTTSTPVEPKTLDLDANVSDISYLEGSGSDEDSDEESEESDTGDSGDSLDVVESD